MLVFSYKIALFCSFYYALNTEINFNVYTLQVMVKLQKMLLLFELPTPYLLLVEYTTLKLKLLAKEEMGKILVLQFSQMLQNHIIL